MFAVSSVESHGDTASLPPSSPQNPTESAALRSVAELLDALDRDGLGVLASVATDASSVHWTAALVALSYSAPLNAMVADALLDRVCTAFSTHLRACQDAFCALRHGTALPTKVVVLSALQQLCHAYERTLPFLQDCCTKLRVPGLASLFSVRVRCALLEADVVTGEEPPGKRVLCAFLHRHGSALLLCRRAEAARGASNEEEVENEEAGSSEGGEEHESHVGTRGSNAKKEEGAIAGSSSDPVVACLHRLTLSQSSEVKQLWKSVLEAGIHEKLEHLSDDFSTHFLHEQMQWLEHTVVPFVLMVLGSEGSDNKSSAMRVSEIKANPLRGASPDRLSAEQETWCAEMRHLLLRSYARRRLDSFWEILSDYPDSTPALEDMHYCLQSNPESSLKAELIHTVRHLLSSRLHRAGTRTEDILAILINTIHAFCTLFPRNEQDSVVFAVVSDTLDHLRLRKDCVMAIVQAVMQPGGAMHAAPPPSAASALPHRSLSKFQRIGDGGASASDAAEALDFLDGLNDTCGGSGAEEDVYRSAARGRPDVLRVLLTSIPRRALVEAYQQVLAEQLLSKVMHDFDTTPEEEVLERLKQIFGEAVLDRCAVMVRDMQMSRRLTQQLREQMTRSAAGTAGMLQERLGNVPRSSVSPFSAPSSCSTTASVTVVSATAWPSIVRGEAPSTGDHHNNGGAGGAAVLAAAAGAPAKYRPHPFLQAEMDLLADAYKKLKDNQRLTWLPSLGRVELELLQRDSSKANALVPAAHTLSLFDASLVLYVKDHTRGGAAGASGGAMPLSTLATVLEVQVEELLPHVQRLSPAVLLRPSNETVTMQLSVASTADYVFVEDKAANEQDAKPAGLPPERVKLMERMITSLLKTRGPQALTAIHSSLKLLAKFEGTNADLLELLQSFIARGLIVLNDAKLYALSPPK